MSMSSSLMKHSLLGALAALLLFFAACNTPEPQEKTPADSGTEKTVAEKPPVREQTPEKGTPPPGVGDACRRSPIVAKGTCPNDRLICVAVNDSDNKCFENCTKTNECADPSEACIAGPRGLKVCYKVAKAGAKCDPLNRIICRRDFADPPEFCNGGVCKARPKDGWDKGDRCTPPRGNQQSDCKSGMLCLTVASDDYRCIQSCKADGDCPKGEICDADTFQNKVCVIPAKENERCARTERRVCKTNDPNKQLVCRDNKCVAPVTLKKVGEKCKQDIDPTKTQGNCEVGLQCLGVTQFFAVCHKPCKANSECPNGETCMMQPNVGKKATLACVIAVKDGGSCDIQKRRLCQGQPGKYFKCKTDADDKTEGTCTEVKIGDKCVNDNDCGLMKCAAVGDPKNKYCLVPCDAAKPNCPGKGACGPLAQGGPDLCMPTGPKKVNEQCTALQAGGDRLNVSGLCVGGFTCITFKQGNPAGVCMTRQLDCTKPCPTKGHVCIPIRGGALCGLNCAKDANACAATKTKCTPVSQDGKTKVCGPNI